MFKSFLYWGLPSPWLPQLSKCAWLLLVAYDVLTLIVVTFALFVYAFTIAMGNMGFQDLAMFLTSLVLYLSALIIYFYQLLYKDHLKEIVDKMDAIAEDIVESKLGHKEEFLQVYSENSVDIINYCRSLPVLYLISSTIFFTSVPLVDWYEGKYRTNFAVEITTPFDYKQPGVYEFVLLFLECALSLAMGKQINNALFFLAFFNTLRSYLKYLSLSMDELGRKIIGNDCTFILKSIKPWIKIHQEINRCLQMVLRIYSPILIIYCVYMMFFLVTALFVHMQEKRNSIYQTFSAFASFVVMVIQVSLIFNIAEQITSEAQDLADVVYDIPWYEMDKRTKSDVHMIIMMCNRPIQITGYRTNSLVLNRETLTGIMTSVLSAYLTLCQMKDAFGSKESAV